MNIRDFIFENFNPGEPILEEKINIDNSAAIRKSLSRMVQSGELSRYSNGIYYIPEITILGTPAILSIDKVIEEKYLKDGDTICGYITGYKFANSVGLTSQLPALYEVVTNKATTDYRKVQIGDYNVVLRKPKKSLNEANYKYFQALDLIAQANKYSETSNSQTGKKIRRYLKEQRIKIEGLKDILYLYTDSIYKQLYDLEMMTW